MRLIDYLNREKERAKKHEDPEKHLKLIEEVKEEYFGKEINPLQLLREARDYVAMSKNYKLLMLIDVVLADSYSNKKL